MTSYVCHHCGYKKDSETDGRQESPYNSHEIICDDCLEDLIDLTLENL